MSIKKQFKAQGLVEISLILGLIAVIGLATLTPLGSKITDMFNSIAPKKNLVVSQSDLSTILTSSNSYDSILSNLKLLSNSKNSATKSIEIDVQAVLNSAGLINSNSTATISNKDLKTVLKGIEESSTETSGSLASIITNLSKDETTQLSAEEKTALSNIKNNVKGSIKLNAASATLQSTTNDTANTIKDEIANNTLTKDALTYDGSPVTAADLASSTIQEIFTKYYSIANADDAKALTKTVNTYLLSENAKDKYTLSAALTGKMTQMNNEIKKALTVEP